MTRWAPEKKHVMSALADEILQHYGKGRTIVAIDGVDGAGKTHFAADLARALEHKGHAAFTTSIDGFHRPRVERYAVGRNSAEGFYRDSYDYSTFRRVLVEPFRMGGSAAFVTAVFDVERDARIEPEWITAPQDALLIVDGIFLNRPELRGLWNFSVWLDVPADVAERRLRERDGECAVSERYTGGQALYLAEASPRQQASALIDNSDFDRPRRVFADSC